MKIILNLRTYKVHYNQILLICLGVFFTSLIAHHFYENNYIRKHEDFIYKQLGFLKYTLETKQTLLKNVCENYKNANQYRLTLIAHSGVVLCDSVANIKKMENHLSRPEIKNAFLYSKASSVRYSQTLGSDSIYASILLNIDSHKYVLRQAIEIDELNTVFTKIKESILWILTPILILLSISSIVLMNYMESKKDKSVYKMKKDLFYNIAHEVKTPLTSIQGYIQAIGINHPDISIEVKSLLDRVASNAKRLGRLFDDILNLSTLEAKTNVYLEIIDIDQFSKAHISNIDAGHSVKNLEIKYSDTGLKLESDYKLLEYIFVNLLENAAKYSPKASVINISWFQNKSDIRLSIEDHGEGISKEDQDHIFERFYRVDSSRSDIVLGTGLGLSIVKHATKTLGARIELESQIGKGSCFTIVFMGQKKV